MADRRQRKTKIAVQNAFMRLMLEKDIAKITVKDVATLADINRSTFYLHYYDVYDIQTEITRDTCEKILQLVREQDFDSIVRDPYPLLKAISDYLTADPLLTKFLLADDAGLYAEIQSALCLRLSRLYAATHPDISAAEIDTSITFATSGVFSVYAAWFRSDRSTPLADVCKQLGLLIADGVRPLVERSV